MVRLPQTSMPLPCQIPVIVAKLMTAIQGLWYQLPVPDKGIFRGVSTRMNARVQHRNSLQKVISCLLVFCLAFYYVGVPTTAYATTADEGVVATDETDSPEQLPHLEDQNEADSPGQQSHPDEDSAETPAEETTDTTDTTDTTEGEGDRDLNAPDPDDPAANEEPDPQHAVSVSSAFDVDSRTITYTVTVSNTGDVALTGVTFLIPPGAEAGEGASSSTGLNGFESAREGESYESFEITDLPADFDLAVGASASFTFTHELVIQPTDGTPVTVGFYATVEAAGETAFGSCMDDCVLPYEAYEVSSYFDAAKADGSRVSGDEPVVVGDTLYFTYVVTNTGNVPLRGIWAQSTGIALVNPSDDWSTATVLQPGESRNFTASHLVTDADTADAQDGYARLWATASIYVNGQSQECTCEGPVVALDYLDVCIRLLYFEGVQVTEYPERNLHMRAFVDDDFYWPVDYIYENCTDGFEIYRPTSFDPITPEELSQMGTNENGEIVLPVAYLRTPTEASYTVNYYKDSVDPANSLGSEYGTGNVGEAIPVSISAAPTGYKADPIVTGPEVIDADSTQNVVNVVYERDSFGYTVNYYSRDYAGQESFLGSTTGPAATYGSTVTVPVEQLNAKLPTGFKALEAGADYTVDITADESQNVIDVTYEPDTFTYTIRYYHDAALDDAYHFQGEPLVGEAVYGSTVHVDIHTLNRNIPDEGFYPKDNDDEFDIVITEDAAANSYNVVYERASYAYTIAYYKDSVAPENLLGERTGVYLWDYDRNLAVPGDTDAFLPEGYRRLVADLRIHITADPAQNVLNVVYDRKRNDLGFTVNYYRDSVDDANLLGSVTGSGMLGSDIPYEVGPFAPVGYDVANAATSGQTLVTADAAANVLNVVYTRQNNLSWRVNYYLGSMDGAPVASETGYGAYGDAIVFEEGSHLAPGYVTPAQVSGDTTIVNLEGDSVLNVVYPLGSYDYTVNYYKDAISADNLLGSDVANGLYGSPVIFEQGKYAPEGYLTTGQTNGALTVGYDVASNVLNIVYTVDSFGYSINYYKGSVADENLVETVHNPTDLRPFGSTVELRASEINTHRPNGYAEVSNARNLVITADAANNVINVVFAPDFDEFYTTGIEPVVTTYDGSTHYVTAPGVVDGDVVTYVCDGVYETRTVGVDENIGLEFTEVTDGDVPVVVMLTRAGIASNAVQTYVNIAPAPVVPDDPDTPDNPDNPDDPVTPDNPDDPDDPDNPDDPANEDPEVPSDIYVPGTDTTTDRSPMGQIAERIFSYVDPGIDVPAPLNATPIESGLDLAGAETIADDANPLAAPAAPQKDFNAVSYLLVVLATLCLAATSILLVVGKHIGNRMMQMSVELAITDERKRRVVKRIATGLGVCAIVLYVLWATLLLL